MSTLAPVTKAEQEGLVSLIGKSKNAVDEGKEMLIIDVGGLPEPVTTTPIDPASPLTRPTRPDHQRAETTRDSIAGAGTTNMFQRKMFMSHRLRDLFGSKEEKDGYLTNEEGNNPSVEPDQQQVPSAKIQSVPQVLKDIASAGNKSCYEPMVVSLGPYHYGNSKYKHMEKLKIPMMKRFFQEVGRGEAKLDESQVRKKFIEEVAGGAKLEEYYDVDKVLKNNPKIGKTEEELVEILFKDSCFLVQFIDSYLSTGERDEMKLPMMMYEIAFVIRDLFLLENQLPFPFVRFLMELRFQDDKVVLSMITRFIHHVRFTPAAQSRKAICPERLRNQLFTASKNKPPAPTMWELSKDPLHLLHALKMRFVDHKKLVENKNIRRGSQPQSEEEKSMYSYRSVTELLAAGVSFRAGKPWGQFTDIHFQQKLTSPILTMTPMAVDDSTPSLFLNLVAFEALPGTSDDLGVTSYLSFMDTLIDTAEDVKEMRSVGILVNFLGSDQQVADMFNTITDQLVPDMEEYGKIKKEIEGHFQSRWRVWIAQWLHAHFNTPWTAIGFLAAAVAVVLSFIQTYYAVFPRN